ncbi:MAG: DUF5671 domain-containing protein [Alphaproteobacteria bacterium]
MAAVSTALTVNTSLDALFADSSSEPMRYFKDIRNSISGIIVSLPLLWFSIRTINRRLQEMQTSPDSRLRAWIMYITMLISTCIVIFMSLRIIQDILDGASLGVASLKQLVILSTAMLCLAYFKFDLTSPCPSGKSTRRFLNWGVLIIMLSAAGFGYSNIPSLETAKELRSDAKKRTQIQRIFWAAGGYFRNKKTAPNSLDDLVEGKYLTIEDTIDLDTGQPFEYSIIDGRMAKICTTFKHEYNDRGPERSHSAGKDCLVSRVGPHLD